MKNLIQLPWSGKGSKAKNDNTLGRMRGGIRSMIGSMSLKNTSLFGVILALLLIFGVGEVYAFDLYVRGIGTWDANNSTHMVDRGSNTQSLYLSLTGNTTYSFKIADDSWDTYNYGGSGSPTLGTAYTLTSGGGDISFKPTDTGVYLFSVNTSTWKLTITQVKPTTAAAANVVNGTNAMFYIQGYEGLNYLVNSSGTKASTTTPLAYTGYSYVNTAKTNLTTYDRISNNPPGWNGDEATNIQTATGGELITRANAKTAAKTASTTASVTGDLLSISTTTSSTTGVYGSLSLYIQYYIDGTFTGVTYSSSTASYGSITAGGETARASTYDVSGLTNGSHTLKTVLTDGNIFWVADQDNFTVAHVYSITYKDQGNVTYSGSNSASLPSSYTYGVGATLVDGVKAGYDFEGWYTASDCSSGLTTSIGTSDTGAKTFYAKWTASATNSLATSAGVGISSTSGDTNPVTLGSKYAISATVETGYTFSGWTASPAANGTFDNASNASTNVTVKNGSVTVTASATENKSTLTTSNHYDAGNPSYSAPSKSVSSIGITTTADLTAAEPGTGYTFVGWTLSSNIVVTSGNSATDRSITVRTNGNGAAATAQANYEEVLSTPYVLNGGSAFGVDTWAQELAFTKKSGEASTDIAYLEVPITTAWESGTNDANYYFKVVNGSSWYGLDAAGEVWNYFSNSGEQTMTTEGGEGNNIRLSAGVLGTYVFKLDYTTPASPKITITWPTTLQIYRSNPEDDTNIGDHTWATHAGNNYTWALDLEANTTYEFKINQEGAYYGHNTDITTSISNRTFATGTGDTKLKTKSAGRFYFTWNGSTHALTLVYPKSAAIDASPASVYDEGTTTLTGYASELGSGSHTITYEFYKGTTLTDANKIATKSKTVTDTHQQETQSVTVDFDGNATSQVYTIQIKEDGSVLATNTVTVYRKWDIYVHDVASWNAMKLYMYSEDGLSHNAEWAGPDCSTYNGSTTWYTVTLDAKYDRFILNNNAGKKQTHGGEGALETDITTYIPGTFWYVSDGSLYEGTTYYGLTKITISAPTVTISATVTNTNQINLTGNITNCGGDGIHASDMKEVYFNVNNVKDAADITVGTTTALFTKTLNNPTPDATNNTLQAVATNIGATGSSSLLRFTKITLDMQSGASGTANVLAVNGAAMASGATAPSRTGYAFGGYYASTGGSGKQYYNASMGSANNWDQTTATKTIYAKWTANTYRVQFHRNGGAGDVVYQNFTYDAAQDLTANTYTRTGYNFAGWALTTDGLVTYADEEEVSNLTAENDATFHLYAKWTPKSCTVNFDFDEEDDGFGNKTGATTSTTATYDAAMTSVTPPTAENGYAFMGYYTEADGEGTQYYDGSGNSAATWAINTTSATTLYAYYKKAEISSLEHAATVAKGDVVTLDVNPVLNVTPADYTAICWTLHYTENDNEVATSGSSYYSVASTSNGSKPLEVRFTLNNMSVGSYYVKAVLKAKASAFSDVCTEGTEFDVETGEFSIVGSSTVTIRYKELTSGDNIAASSSVEIEAGGNADVVAPDIVGYTFDSWSLGAGVTKNTGALTDETINISSPYDGVITAFYTKKQLIYFNNTLGWSDVYVYFYSSDAYWDEYKGSGANKDYEKSGKKAYYREYHGQMTQIEGTNIWYYDYMADWGASNSGEISGYEDVVFTEAGQHTYENFHATKACRRGDFKHSLSMFVPLDVRTDYLNATEYFNNGYWMNYPDNTGYTLRIYDNNTSGALKKEIMFPFTTDKKMPISITTDLESGKTYGFTIYRADGNVYGNSGTMTNGHSGDDGQTVWEFTHNAGRSGLTTTSAGDYTFTLNYGQDASSNYNYLVGVRYPESVGDFRVQYKDGVNSTWKTSAVIPAVTETDTVSYFVRYANTPYIRVQKCTAVDGSGNPTWSNENSGSNIISSLPSAITENGVYNFIFKKSSGALVLDKAEPYTGNFYIRVDGAGSTNWDNYRAADHLMPFSEYSFNQATDPFSHYYTQWYIAESEAKNIKFVVANDYSTNISDTITRDGIANAYVDSYGNLSGRNASVRFMYNYKTNVATRRYIDGAQEDDSEFLLLIPSNSTSIYNAATAGNAYSQVKFSDNGNWVYEANVWVVPGTQYKLKSQFGVAPNIINQYFKGKETGTGEYETLVGGDGGSRMQIRLLYDFKTNRLVTGYVPSSTIDSDIELNADIMFVREHQGNVTQITFGEGNQISEIQNVYSTLKLNCSTINNSALSRYERDLYYVSFPYDVLVSDIIGFGTYGTHWIIEYYDGAERAEKGFWADSKSFWKFVTPSMKNTFKLKAGTGYIVALDLDELWWTSEDDHSSVWDNTTEVELIFPGDISSISNQSVTYTLPQHQCNIGPRFEGGEDRRVKDSHWNVLGVPTYCNTTGSFANHTDEIGGKSQVWSADNAPKYLYTWNMTDNSLSVTNATDYNYKAMHAYVVQYYGNVTFHNSTNAAPSSVIARNYTEAPIEIEFRIDLMQNDEAVDQTFVTMSNDEQVSADFAFGEDLSKEFNSGKANIYTFIADVQSAGNTLPMTEQTTVVPVGVKIAANSDYTFSIPEGTEGIGVTLIDKERGIRTSLSAVDYTVSLEEGTYNERFVLEISPIHNMPTEIEPSAVSDQQSDVRKLLIDGLLYMVRDGKVYDARGARIE